jgi:hypothetical protein
MSLFSNSNEVAQREELAENDFERGIHRDIQGQMAAGHDHGPQLNEDHFQELVEAGVPEDTVFHLRSLLSRDFVLSNLSEAEVHEMRWLARNLALRVFAIHPSKKSHMTGSYRQWVFDEPNQGLSSLSDGQRAKIRSFILAYIARVSRSKAGWQQEELSRQYQVSEMRTDSDDDDGGWFK